MDDEGVVTVNGEAVTEFFRGASNEAEEANKRIEEARNKKKWIVLYLNDLLIILHVN